MSSSPSFLDPFVLPSIRGESVLDVGCGYGRWAALISCNYWEFGHAKPPIIDGLDGFESNVKLCREHGYYRNVWHQVMPSEIDGSWDTVLACEFIEHIEQDAVDESLLILERAAKKRVILSTPNWPYFRSGSDTIVGFNSFEAHLSHNKRRYFKDRGYSTITAGFGNPSHWVVKKFSQSRLLPLAIRQFLPHILPQIGHSVIAVKDIHSSK